MRIRTIKPELWTSEQIISCSPIARLLFIGLLNFCDDAGIHPASFVRIKAEIFPADTLTINEIKTLINELIKNNLMIEYKADDGKQYWQVTGWKNHQKIERPTYKFPPPNPENLAEEKAENSTTPRRHFDEHSTNTRRALGESSPPESNGVESKGKELETTNVVSCSEQNKFAHELPAKPIISLLLNSGKEFHLPQAKLNEFQECYPAVDVSQELKKIKAWFIANPTRRKTKKGILRSINSWLAKEQDKPRAIQQSYKSQSQINQFAGAI